MNQSDDKISFLKHLAEKGMQTTPGDPDTDKKLKFLQAFAKHGLKHFDTGGLASTGGLPANQTTIGANNPVAQPNDMPAVTGAMSPGTAVGGNQFVAHPSQSAANVWSSTANGVTPGGSNPLSGVIGGMGQMGSNAAHGLGDTFQGIGSAFTAQNAYNANLAPTDYTNYGNVVGQAAQNSLAGYGNAQSIQQQQQGLANQLQRQTQGGGPNPAQAQLSQTTGQNIASQGALAAGQRGASSNAGLMARQVGQAGAATQQNAVGQAATLRAQQQLSAQQQLASQQASMAGTNISEQGVNNQLFGGAASAQNAQNANNISNYGMAQGINAQVAQNNANAVNKTTAGLMAGVSSLVGAAKGGLIGLGGMDDHHHAIGKVFYPKHYEIQKYADGGPIYSGSTTVGYTTPTLQGGTLPDAKSKKPDNGPDMDQANAISGMDAGGGEPLAGADAGGSGDIGSLGAGVMAAKKGGKVPGKAPIKNDSYKNDTVPAMLSAGEIVLPRHITTHPNAPEKAAEFVRAVLAKKGMRAKQ